MVQLSMMSIFEGHMAKKKKQFDYKDFHFQEVSKMFVRLTKDSDRAVVLILTAWLDDAITQMIKTTLVNDKKVVEDMFRHDAALGTFSSKIGMAYLTRRISRAVYDELQTIRGIRNDFAHSRDDLRFTEESIRDRCKNLYLSALKDKRKNVSQRTVFNPRDAFIATGIGILGFFIEFMFSPTMSADGKDDYFPKFMKHMEEWTIDMVAKFSELEKK